MTDDKPKHEVGDKIKSDAKFDYIITQKGPKLLFKVKYENLEENFSELVAADEVKDLSNNLFINKKESSLFASEGDKVKVKLFGEWKVATVLCTQFGEYEITCFKKDTKKPYFSEWIIGKSNPKDEQTVTTLKEDGNKATVQRGISKTFIPIEQLQESSINQYLFASGFKNIRGRVQEIVTSESWDEILNDLNSFFIKPQWDGTEVGNEEFHIFLLSCNLDPLFADRLTLLLESQDLKITTDEEQLHKARILLLLYTDNASYDARLIRLLTRGAELANSGELCITVLVHPTCSGFRQNRIPDNMAYTLADSKWYNWIGVDSPNVSFNEMVSQMKNYTSRSQCEAGNHDYISGTWLCKVVVSGDFCSDFYDNRTMTLYLKSNEEGKLYGRTPSGILLEGTLDDDKRILDISGAYCGPWKQENEGWSEDNFQIMLRIRGIVDYKGSRFEGQYCEVSQVDGKMYECVGTLSATLENEGVSGFYEMADAISSLKGESTFMTVIHQRGGDILVDMDGYHGVMFPGTIHTATRKFTFFINNGPMSCTTYEGVFNTSCDSALKVSGTFFKCNAGLTVIPKTKFEAKIVSSIASKNRASVSDSFTQLVEEAKKHTLRSSVINSYTYVPPKEDDLPVIIIGAEEDLEIKCELKYNLTRAGVAPVSCDLNCLESARSVCLILTKHIADNIDLISSIKLVASKNVPFFIIANDARRKIFDDKCWKNVDLKEKLLNCLARLKQSGKLTLDPTSLLFKTLVKEIKNHYKPPVYFLSGMWSVRPFGDVVLPAGLEEKSDRSPVPKLLYILCDGISGKVVGINDFVSSKPFKGDVNNEKATFQFDNEDSKYELVIEQDGQSMQGTYTNRLHDFRADITLTLEIDEISGVYTVKDQNLLMAVVKTGQHSVDVYYRHFVLSGVFENNHFYVTIPRVIRRKPVLSTICGVLQRSMSGSSLICMEFASLANTRALCYEFEYLQTRFQKLDEADKIGVTCEPTVLEMVEQYIQAFNDIAYEDYRDLHADRAIESQEAYQAQCKHTQDHLGVIKGYEFVGRRQMMEKNLAHLAISRYEFDLKYETKVRREFFIIDENCLLRGAMSLEEEALQFHSSLYDVMITYRSVDSGWADLLQGYLESNEVLCWRDQRMEIGANWSSDITSAIRLAKCELCLLSEEYLKSEMCTKEISLAYDSGKIIIPLVLPYTDQCKKRPLVKSTYKPAYPPHQISHETSQSTWIDFRPVSSDKDPENVEEFQEVYGAPLEILLNRLQLSKSRSHICDVNGQWVVLIEDTTGKQLRRKFVLEYIRRTPQGLLQDETGKPVARLSPQSVIKGTRLLLYFQQPRSAEIVLGIRAMMSGDNKSFSGVLLGAESRSTVYATKVESHTNPVEHGPLIFTSDKEKPSPNFTLLHKTFPQYSYEEIGDMFEKFCEIDTGHDYRISADEIVTCLRKIGKPLPKRLVSEQIRKFDVKQSGVLEFDEFLRFLTLNSPGAGGTAGVMGASKVCSIQ